MPTSPVELTRTQILAFRRRAGALDERLPPGARSLRQAAPTGTVLIRWDGARTPAIWTVPRPEIKPQEARSELARRYLHVFGPATPEAFSTWAGVGGGEARATFAALGKALTAVQTPLG